MTIKDIAKLCGVSVSTVSRVLNERPDVSPSVREKVLEAVRLSQTKYCGVSAMLSKAFAINYEVRLNAESIGFGKADFS